VGAFARRVLVPLPPRATSDQRVGRSKAMAQRLSRLWESRRARPRSPALEWQHRVETLEKRLEHLEAELEGLQDAVHRRAVAEDEQIDELRRRTAPDQLVRDLSEDARRRGL
jgi:hypothetical protein